MGLAAISRINTMCFSAWRAVDHKSVAEIDGGDGYRYRSARFPAKASTVNTSDDNGPGHLKRVGSGKVDLIMSLVGLDSCPVP